MTSFDFVLAAMGFAALMWFAFGFLWVTFGMEVIMPPAPWNPPIRAKVQMVFVASFVMPWVLFTVGSLPRKMAMLPDPECIPPETRDAYLKWRSSQCDCERCRAQRGEL